MLVGMEEMKIAGIIILSVILFGCNNVQKKKTFKNVNIEFISSNYKNENREIIDFSRILKDSLGIHFIEGKISFDKNYNTIQEITKNEIINEKQINIIKSDLKNRNYREEFDNYNKILFVQMQPRFDNDLEVLNLRQTIEEKINQKLSNQKLGEWVAGDIGPGGANMLFEVKDWNKSIMLVMESLNNEGLLEKCLIMKRLNIARDDWNYEIVFPIDYNGIFNQM